jgi:methionyl aminopeptidase
MISLKKDQELALMRKAGRLVALTLQEVVAAVKPGVTTKELDRIAEKFIRSYGGEPAFKGYNGYPATLCVSVDDQVVHGIPGKRLLREGQIVSLDVGAIVEGFYGDSAITVPVGRVSQEAELLMRITRESLGKAIEKAVVGNRLSDISHAVQAHAEGYGLSIVKDYVGHGIGRAMHEAPAVPNFGPPNRGLKLAAGMTLAIEPMVNFGSCEVETLLDNWTVVTVDGSLSAHFEHTIAITPDGPEILTLAE